MNELRLRIKRTDRPFFLPLFLALMALAGGLIIWFNSPWGVEAGYDSFFYITAAKNLLSGVGLGRLQPDGLLIPLTHYPPLYSWLLAGLGLLFHGDILLAARLFSALMFALHVFLFGWITFYFTRSRWFAAAAALLALVSPIFYFLNLSAMTE